MRDKKSESKSWKKHEKVKKAFRKKGTCCFLFERKWFATNFAIKSFLWYVNENTWDYLFHHLIYTQSKKINSFNNLLILLFFNYKGSRYFKLRCKLLFISSAFYQPCNNCLSNYEFLNITDSLLYSKTAIYGCFQRPN